MDIHMGMYTETYWTDGSMAIRWLFISDSAMVKGATAF